MRKGKENEEGKKELGRIEESEEEKRVRKRREEDERRGREK